MYKRLNLTNLNHNVKAPAPGIATWPIDYNRILCLLTNVSNIQFIIYGSKLIYLVLLIKFKFIMYIGPHRKMYTMCVHLLANSV